MTSSQSYLPYTLYYGGIPIPYNKTSMQIEPEYDPSGIDFLYNHITITAQGLINPNIIYNINSDNYFPGSPSFEPGDVSQKNREAFLFNNAGGDTAGNATALLWLRTWLNTPRQRLIMTDYGGNVMIDTYILTSYGSSTIDAKNGPSPKAIVVDFDGYTFSVNITIETWLAECATVDGQDNIVKSSPSVILSNRWSMSQTIDENGLSTYTTTGMLILRTDVLRTNSSDPSGYLYGSNPWASVFRNVLTPITSIFTNCNRISQSYKQSADNTKLEYTVVDQEKYRPGVSGITSFEAEFDQSCTIIGAPTDVGANVIGVFNGVARGNPSVSKQSLFSFLVQVMYSRVGDYDNLIKYSVKELLHNNELSFTATWLLQPTKVGKVTSNVPSITNNQTVNLDNFKLRIQDTSGSGNTDNNRLGIGAPVPVIDNNNLLVQVNGSNYLTSNLTVNPAYNVGHVRNGAQPPGSYNQNVPPGSGYSTSNAPPIFATIFSNYVNDTLASNYCTYPLLSTGDQRVADNIYQRPQSDTNSQPFSTNPLYVQPASGSGGSSNSAPSGSYGGGSSSSFTGGIISAIQQEAAAVAAAIIGFTDLFSNFTTQIAPVQNNPLQYYLSYTIEQQMNQNNGTLQLPIGASFPSSGINQNNTFGNPSVQPYSGGNSPISYSNNNPFCNSGKSLTTPPAGGYSNNATPNAPSGSTQTSSFVQVARGQDTVTVIFNASRMNSCPDVPALSSFGESYYVLLGTHLTMFNPTFLPDGVNRIFSVHGELTFGVIASQQLGSVPLLFPKTPVDTQGICNFPQLAAPLANSPEDSFGNSGAASVTKNGQLIGNLFAPNG